MEPRKPLEHKYLMPYVSDLSEHWQIVGGHCGLQSEVEKLKQDSNTADDHLSHILYQWLQKGEAPHTWDFFIDVVASVGKEKVAQRIEKDVFGTNTRFPEGPHESAAVCKRTYDANTQFPKKHGESDAVYESAAEVSQQWQIQYPFIDELGDSFAMLVAEVKEKVHQLELSERSKLKMIVEEKLGTKGAARKVSLSAESAEQLMDGMRQYWDFLSFEILQLVVKFLKDKELARYLREYEESVRERVTQTLEECKNNKIKPQAPPKCAIVPLKLHVDPRSYSLDKVLQMQDFLVYKMGIKLALFAGWMKGSVILYFYILESDVENVTLHLKDPECLRLLCLTLDVQNVQVGLCKGIVHGKFVEVNSQMQLEEMRLLQDAEFDEARKAMEVIEQSLKKWLVQYDHAIEALKEYQEQLEKSYHKRTISKVAGASVAIVGSGLAITGFGLSFVTFGASLGLTVAGGAAAVAGGMTMGGADLGNWIKLRPIMKRVRAIVNDCDKIFYDMQDSEMKIKASCESLSVKFPSFSEEQILLAVSHNVESGLHQAVKAAQAGSTICQGGKVTGVSLLRTGVRLGGNTCTSTVGAVRIAWTGLHTVAGGLSIAGVALDVATLPLDVFVLAKGAYDIHKYRTGKGSNSNAAKRVKKAIDQLIEGRQTLMAAQEASGQLQLQVA